MHARVPHTNSSAHTRILVPPPGSVWCNRVDNGAAHEQKKNIGHRILDGIEKSKVDHYHIFLFFVSDHNSVFL